MKRVMIAIHALSHDGAERVAVLWAEYLLKQGYEVAFLIKHHVENEKKMNDSVKVLSIAESSKEYSNMSLLERLIKARRLLETNETNILISFLPTMQILMMLATLGMRLDRIETIRNNPWIDKDIGKKRFLWDLCFRRANKIIVQTPEQREYFPPVLQKKCTVISNPISREFLSRKKEYLGKIRKFVAVGRFSEQKNYPLMIRAFALAASARPDCTLDIYGAASAEMVEATNTLIRQMNMDGRICLRGWTGNISELLPEYDAFLMSSNYEGMPNALAEAMATGLVCISTNCRTGPKDMIDHGQNGRLVSVSDVDAYAEEIKTVLKMDVHECVQMGAAAREKMLEMCSDENTLAQLKVLVETD